METQLKILYAGALWDGGTCRQRMITLQELGNKIIEIDTCPDKAGNFSRNLAHRVLRRLLQDIDLAATNSSILAKIKYEQFDILWLDKCLTIKPSTLEAVKKIQRQCIIAGYSPDDMTGNKKNRSKRWVQSLPYYDIYFTTKTYCVKELENLSCPHAEFIGNAYDEHIHKPCSVNYDDRRRLGGPVGFIGQWEPQRANSLAFLAKSGVEVRVWGYTWERCITRHENLKLENKPLWGDDYARAICSFDINLCFLRKANRDLQTTRSIEIPACGAFMLAERTDEHLALFEEGKEAEYFSSNEELIDKVRYYLANEDKRNRIAAAGRDRCIKSGYSNWERLRKAITEIGKLRSP